MEKLSQQPGFGVSHNAGTNGTGSANNSSTGYNEPYQNGYPITVNDMQFPESLDSLIDSLENTSGVPYFDEDWSMPAAGPVRQQFDNDMGVLTSPNAAHWLGFSQSHALPLIVPHGGFTTGSTIRGSTTNTKSTSMGLPVLNSNLMQIAYPQASFAQLPVLAPAVVRPVQNAGCMVHPAQTTVIQNPNLATKTVKAQGSTSKSLKRLHPSSSFVSSDNQDIAVSEDEEDHSKRRQGRNIREQLRSQRIAVQINDLRELLKLSNVEFKPDKFSTLVTVDQYINSLQKDAATMDDQLKRLLLTISQTTEIVNNQYMPTRDDDCTPILFDPNNPSSDNINHAHATTSTKGSRSSLNIPEEQSKQFVRDINYKFIFDCCPFACSITGSDGRFIDCNDEFFDTTGFLREEVILENDAKDKTDSNCNIFDDTVSPIACISSEASGDLPSRPPSPGTLVDITKKVVQNKSLFNVLHRESIEGVFCAMSSMLKFREDKHLENLAEGDTWVSTTKLARKETVVSIRVSLVRNTNGLPRFFNCVLFPLD